MPVVNQTVQNPNQGSSHNLTCTIKLPVGVSPDLLQIEWSHRSLMPSDPRVIISNLTSTAVPRQYTKIVTFQQVQSVDNGNYTCIVSITGFITIRENITVNGENVVALIMYCLLHLIVVCMHII